MRQTRVSPKFPSHEMTRCQVVSPSTKNDGSCRTVFPTFCRPLQVLVDLHVLDPRHCRRWAALDLVNHVVEGRRVKVVTEVELQLTRTVTGKPPRVRTSASLSSMSPELHPVVRLQARGHTTRLRCPRGTGAHVVSVPTLLQDVPETVVQFVLAAARRPGMRPKSARTLQSLIKGSRHVSAMK